MKKNDAKHEFALYIQEVSELVRTKRIGDILNITDKDGVHRITRVLRLQPKEHMVLFDTQVHISAEIQSIGKRDITLKIFAIDVVHELKPHLTILLPVLKRDHLDEAIYSLVEMGVNTIQLVTTSKTQRAWGKEKEFDRLERIMIGAAEQSKNFALPSLLPPKALIDCINNDEVQIFFDPAGEHVVKLWEIISKKEPQRITLLVGPEGDLTQEEKEIVKNVGFMFCQLTPTILRAHQAVALAAGIVRSLQ